MAFTEEQTEEIKKQILQQIETLNIENKEQIKEHVEKLDESGLEEFLKQNNIKTSETGLAQQPEKPIFELIINNEVPSYKIAENEHAIAILEISPLSKGHCLVIPKQKTSIEKINKDVFSLAQKISKKIKTKLKPDEIKIETFSLQNYPAINIIPLYKNNPLKKTKASEEELKILQEKLATKKRTPNLTKKPKLLKNIPEISFRIP